MISSALPNLVVNFFILFIKLGIFLVHMMKLVESYLPLFSEKTFVFATKRIHNFDLLIFMLGQST